MTGQPGPGRAGAATRRWWAGTEQALDGSPDPAPAGWLSGLSPECRHVLRVAAAVGVSFSASDVAVLLERRVAALLPTIDEALAAGVLVERQQLLAFRETRLWREAVAAIPGPVLQCLRREVDAVHVNHPDGGKSAGRSRGSALGQDGLPAWAVGELERGLFLPEAAAMRRDAEQILAERADQPGDHPATVPAATVLSNLQWDDGEAMDSLRLGAEAVAAIDAATPPSWRLYARLALAYKLVSLRDTARAAILVQEADQDATRPDLAGPDIGTTVVRARLHLLAGRLDQAKEEAETALRISAPSGERLYTQLARSVLSMIALHAGDRASAARQVELLRAEIDEYGYAFPRSQFDWLSVLVTTDHCDERRATEVITESFPQLTGHPALFLEEPGAAAWIVRLALAAGNGTLVTAVVREVRRLAVRFPDLPTVVTAASHAQALADGNLALLELAAAEHSDLWAAALAAEDLGVRLAACADRRADALRSLRAAKSRFDQLGFRREAARVRNWLRRLGVHCRDRKSVV